MSKWQKIETAPKDGTKILTFTVHGDYEINEWYEAWRTDYKPVDDTDYFEKVEELYFEGWNGNNFTHWMPLPEPPE